MENKVFAFNPSSLESPGVPQSLIEVPFTTPVITTFSAPSIIAIFSFLPSKEQMASFQSEVAIFISE